MFIPEFAVADRMAPQPTRYPLCPGVLDLHTDAVPIPDFQLGPRADVDLDLPASPLTVEYGVGDLDGFDGSEKGIWLHGDAIRYHKPLGLFGGLQCEISIGPRRSRLTVNRTYHRLGRRSIGTVPSVGELLRDIVSIQLLMNGYALLYCGAVANGDEASVIVGLTNAGKTTAVLDLVRRGRATYVAEDIAVTDGERVYCCPFVVSPVDADFLDVEANSPATRIAKQVPLLDTVSVHSIDSIFDLLAPDQITLSGQITRLNLLAPEGSRGDGRDPARMVALANRGEFTYATNQILQGAAYLGYGIDVDEAMETERDVIRSVVRNGEPTVFTSKEEDLSERVVPGDIL